MTAAPAPSRSPSRLQWLRGGLRFNGRTFALIVAISVAMALVQWIPDPRPFWHPLVSALCFGLTIAYAVNVARPWESPAPLRRLTLAVAAGSLLGILLVVLVKRYSWSYIAGDPELFAKTLFGAFFMGLLISLMFHARFREARNEAALREAEAERYRLAKQAVEAQLMVMQAQVEPHFLFNTLASVQYLTETDPREANRLLGHLIAYLRSSLPQLRATSSTLGNEFALAREYLSILKMRMGDRLTFDASLPEALAHHPFPPNMLISLVENAIKHGVEPAARGGHVVVGARADDEGVRVEVTDTGRGLASVETTGSGVGVANVRERLSALYGDRGRFTLEPGEAGGTRATIVVPRVAA